MDSEKYTPQDIAHLILVCRNNEADNEQYLQLQEWLQESNENQAFYESVQSHSYFKAGLDEYKRYNSRQDWKQVQKKIVRKKRQTLILKLLPYAAVVTLILVVSSIIIYNKLYTLSPSLTENQAIKPGTSKAQLILANGEQIELEKTNDNLYHQINTKNFSNNGQQLIYTPGKAEGPAPMHTLQTSRGGEYKVILADGTQVWLNAESQLIYPETFTQNIRKVFLSGEAYFEVTKDTTKPFYVVADNMEIKVLGTSFNISAYPKAKRQTTLVEGHVSVGMGRQQVEILPGQQVTAGPAGLEVKYVNVHNYTGWKEKRFIYKDKLLGEVFEDLERWYNVKIFIINDEIRNFHLTANLSRYENLDKVLEIIEYAVCVKFEVKGRTIVVHLDK